MQISRKETIVKLFEICHLYFSQWVIPRKSKFTAKTINDEPIWRQFCELFRSCQKKIRFALYPDKFKLPMIDHVGKKTWKFILTIKGKKLHDIQQIPIIGKMICECHRMQIESTGSSAVFESLYDEAINNGFPQSSRHLQPHHLPSAQKCDHGIEHHDLRRGTDCSDSGCRPGIIQRTKKSYTLNNNNDSKSSWHSNGNINIHDSAKLRGVQFKKMARCLPGRTRDKSNSINYFRNRQKTDHQRISTRDNGQQQSRMCANTQTQSGVVHRSNSLKSKFNDAKTDHGKFSRPFSLILLQFICCICLGQIQDKYNCCVAI